MSKQSDNLGKAAQAGELASEVANTVANSGVLGQKAAATTAKVGLGLSLFAGILAAFKSVFGKK